MIAYLFDFIAKLQCQKTVYQ